MISTDGFSPDVVAAASVVIFASALAQVVFESARNVATGVSRALGLDGVLESPNWGWR